MLFPFPVLKYFNRKLKMCGIYAKIRADMEVIDLRYFGIVSCFGDDI